MIKCQYTQSISKIRLSQEFKNQLVENLYNAQQAMENKTLKVNTQSAKTAKKGKKKWVVLTSVCTALVIIAICISMVAGIGVFNKHRYVVNNPISNDLRIYMTNRTNNAQYLPNIYLLAGQSQNDENGTLATSSESSLATSNETNKYESMMIDDDELLMTLEDYQEINDNLGIIDARLHEGNMTVEDVKEEIKFIMTIIPGYGQWFRLPHNLPHIMDQHKYGNYMYKFDYDEQTKHISMTRIVWKTTESVYDSTTNKIYSSYLDDDCHQREVLQVDFYYDEDGREVVECTNTRYFFLNNEYYPVSTHYLKNVKDTATSKLSIYYTFENELIEEYVTDKNPGNPLDEVFVIQDIHKYGAIVKYVQLNYTDSNDISMLKIGKVFPTLYESYPITANMAFYRKQDNNMVYYIDAWDYFDEQNSTAYCDLQNIYDVNFVYDYDKEDYTIQKDEIKRSLRYDILYYHLQGKYCTRCQHNNQDNFIRTCRHFSTSENITRGEDLLLYNADSKYQDINLVRQDIGIQLENMAKTILGTQKPFVWEDNGDYAFESSIDGYIDGIAKSYIDDIYRFDNIVNIVKEAEDSYARIEEDQVIELIENTNLVIKGLNSRSSFIDGLLYYDISILLTNAVYDKDKEYYLAIALYDDDDDKMLVIGQKRLDLDTSTRNYSLVGYISYQEILERCYWTELGNEAYAGEIIACVVNYSENGTHTFAMPYEELEIEKTDYNEYRSIYTDAYGNQMEYYFRGGNTIYFNFYVY